MKVTFKYNIATYSGTLNEMTYSSFNDGEVCIGRQWVLPVVTPQQTSLGSIARNLSTLYAEASEAWKTDLKAYAQAYATEHVGRKQIAPSAYALFIKLMYSYKDYDSTNVDLDTLAFGDLETLVAPVITIKGSIEAGLLPNVNNSDTLTAHI